MKHVYAASVMLSDITFSLKYLGCTSISKYMIAISRSDSLVCEDPGQDTDSRYICSREGNFDHFIESFHIRNYSVADSGCYCFQPRPQELNLTAGVQVCPLCLSKYCTDYIYVLIDLNPYLSTVLTKIINSPFSIIIYNNSRIQISQLCCAKCESCQKVKW